MIEREEITGEDGQRGRGTRFGGVTLKITVGKPEKQPDLLSRPCFSLKYSFFLKIYFLAARVKLLFIKIHVLQLIMFIKCPHKKCFKMHQRIQAWVGLHKYPNAGLQAGKVMKSKRCIGSVGKSN